MNVPDIFLFSDYVVFLSALVKANNEQRGFQSLLCQKLGCQPATFSRALNNGLELTRDQVANLCQVLNLNEQESEYLLSSYDFKLSGSQFLRQRAQLKMKNLKLDAGKLSSQLKEVSESLNNAIAFEYYSSWTYSAVNILLMVPGYQSFNKIKSRLKIEDDELLLIIGKLIEWGLVRKTKSGFESLEKSLHLDRTHPVSNIDQINWRLKAIEDIQKKRETSIHYSAIFSMSKKDYEQLQKIITKDIKKHRDIIIPSKSEEVFVCNMDLFEL